MGHIGVKRLVKELQKRYAFPPSVRIFEKVKEAKRRCVTCQACDPPNWNTSLPLSATPVPDCIMTSVALDVFALPATEWLGQNFDSLLVCVDRLSG